MSQPAPIVTFRSPSTLSSHLVRAKIDSMERKTGSRKCKGNSCQECLNISETETLISTVTLCHIKLTIALTVITNAWYVF